MIEFSVSGVPAPKGSHSVGRGRQLIDGSTPAYREKLKSWTEAVREAAADQLELTGPFAGPVHVEMRFRFPMPKSRPKWQRVNGWLWKQSKPDIDKVMRATFDAMQASGLLQDDYFAASVLATKIEVSDSSAVGATVLVRALTQPARRAA